MWWAGGISLATKIPRAAPDRYRPRHAGLVEADPSVPVSLEVAVQPLASAE